MIGKKNLSITTLYEGDTSVQRGTSLNGSYEIIFFLEYMRFQMTTLFHFLNKSNSDDIYNTHWIINTIDYSKQQLKNTKNIKKV